MRCLIAQHQPYTAQPTWRASEYLPADPLCNVVGGLFVGFILGFLCRKWGL